MNIRFFHSELLKNFPIAPIPDEPLDNFLHSSTHDYVDESRAAVENRPWTTIDLLIGTRNQLALSFVYLKPSAKLYYLPGFMYFLLNPQVRKHNGVLLDSFLRHIDPRRSGDEEFNENILNMSRQQSALVTCFLMEIVRIEGNRVAMESLENYWDIFEKDIPHEYLSE